MGLKQEFLEYLTALQEAAPEVVEAKMTDNIRQYIELLDEKIEKPALTDSGKNILSCLQTNFNATTFKSVDIGNFMGKNSRAVASSLRKLVEDGFCEKVSQNPTVYNLTEKGKTYII